MKACMVAYTFYESDNRVRRYAETLIKEGWQVDAVALYNSNSSKDEVLNGVNVYKIQKRTVNEKNKLQYLFRLLIFLVKSTFFLLRKSIIQRYDIIHVHSVPDFEVFSAFFAKISGSKVILDIHDLVPELFTSKFGTKKHNLSFKVLSLVENFSCRFADHVIIANDIWRKRLINRSVSGKRCTTILNYPDLDIFKKSPVEKEKDCFSLVYPGTLSKHQGIETAIRAVDVLKNTIPQIRFLIYGSGTDEAYFKKIVIDLKLEHFVKFYGSICFDKIPKIMQKADIGIEPKLSNGFSDEAFSTKIFEFMTLGIPLVVSDTTVHKYYINDSQVLFHKAGDVEDLAEKIMVLYNNTELRLQLVSNSYEFISNFSWEKNKNIYMNIINFLIENKNVLMEEGFEDEYDKFVV